MITKLERAALWAERRSETKAGVVRGAEQPKPKPRQWAFTAMLERGELSIRQWRAAALVAEALECATAPAQASLDRVDRYVGSHAARAYAAVQARLRGRLALDHALAGQSAPRQRVIRAALTAGPTLSQLARIYSPRSKNVSKVKQILRETCNRLLDM